MKRTVTRDQIAPRHGAFSGSDTPLSRGDLAEAFPHAYSQTFPKQNRGVTGYSYGCSKCEISTSLGDSLYGGEFYSHSGSGNLSLSLKIPYQIMVVEMLT